MRTAPGVIATLLLSAASAHAAEMANEERMGKLGAICFEEPCQGAGEFVLPEGSPEVSTEAGTARSIIGTVTRPGGICLKRQCDEAIRQQVEFSVSQWPLSYEDQLNQEATALALAHQLFNVADTIQTADCRARGICREVNPAMDLPIPLFVAAKAAVGVGSWIMFDNMRGDDPERAREFAYRAALVSGGTVMFNARISSR